MAPSAQPTRLGVGDAARAIERGELSAHELTRALLERIDATDGRLRAWVRVERDHALERARELDAELAEQGPRGPLHGIPFAAKDIFDVAGLPTRAGSRLLDGHVAKESSSVVELLEAAGAIVLGKTTTSEWALLDPTETRNPWGVERTPGGSSAGSAAAVAASCVPFALGSQTGGSTGRPASFCGIVGYKPTFGRVSLCGVVAVSPSLDHFGVLTRSVDDSASVLSALEPGGFDELRETGSPRIGVLRHPLFDDESGASPSVRTVVETALSRMREGGMSVVERTAPPSFDEIVEGYLTVVWAEVAETHRERFSQHAESYGAKIRDAILAGQEIGRDRLDEARALQTRARNELEATAFDGVDALLTPGAVTTAPEGLASTGSPAFQIPFSFTGLPAIVIPAGMAPDGMPVGVQLVGRAGGDRELLEVARACERVLAFGESPPI